MDFNAFLDMRTEKTTAPHSSTLAWKIPWTEEPGGLQSMGSLRLGHDWATSLSLFTFMPWRGKWQPTPVLLPGESQGREPGGLSSMGSHRVGHDWSDLAAAAADMRSYKNWAHKTSSWEYLTIWRPVLPVFPEHRVLHVCSPSWAPWGGVGGQQLQQHKI